MDDLSFDIDILGGFDPEKDKWEALIEATMAGNVVPVIGPDIVCEPRYGMNINQSIISAISKQLGLTENHLSYISSVADAS